MKTLLCAALSVSLLLISTAFGATPIMDFDWPTNQDWKSPYKNWRYIPKGDDSCGVDQTDRGNLCNDAHRLFLFSDHNPSSPTGWIRNGVMFQESKYTVDGQGMRLVFTSGEGPGANGERVIYGEPILDADTLLSAERSKQRNLYAGVRLPGSASLFYKPQQADAATLGLFSAHNRFSAYIWVPADADRHVRYSRESNPDVIRIPTAVSWYPFLDTPKKAHYYHHTYNRDYGGWRKVQFDAHPSHKNIGPYAQYHEYSEGGNDALDGQDYFSRVAAFALVFEQISGSISPYTVLTDEWEADFASDENEETIASLSVGFDPEHKEFDLSLEDKFRCAECFAEYEVRYSFSPINNDNYAQANSVEKVENFYIEDDTPDNRLVKANPYTNGVWGKVVIRATDARRFIAGERLYFAVKDKSARPFGLSENDMQHAEKVKTIAFDYAVSPGSPRLILPERLSTPAYHRAKQFFEVRGVETHDDVQVEAEYEVRAQIFGEEGGRVLDLYPFQEGVYPVTLVSSSADFTGRPVRGVIDVSVSPDRCGQTVECVYHGLVDYSAGTSDVQYPEFIRTYHDNYTGYRDGGIGIAVGDNTGYNYQGVAGPGVSVAQEDLVAIRISNAGGVSMDLTPRVSSKHERRPGEVGDDGWLTLPSKQLGPGESATWEVPANMVAYTHLGRLTVNLTHKDAVLHGMGLYRQEPLHCNNCGNTLINFFAGGIDTTTPWRGWHTVLMDAYTGRIGSASGVVVGSNGGYNYQGVAGVSDLPYYIHQLGVHWVNYSEKEVTFTPQFSTEDSDRPVSGVDGRWFSQGEITLPPGGRFMQAVDIPGGMRVFNTNINSLSPQGIGLEKITLVGSPSLQSTP